MRVNSLSVNGFRNFASCTIDFVPGVNILFGGNAAGKTNLLEALFVICLGRSQRGATDTVLLHRDCDTYRLEAVIRPQQQAHRLAVAFQRGGRKRVTLDGIQATVAELYGRFCAVSAGPEDSDVLAGPPSARRTFLDIYLSQLTPAYLADLSRYQKVLAQKNGALKRDMDPSAFDPQLVKYGVKIIHARQGFISSVMELAVGYHREISGGESLDMTYRPSIPLGDVDTEPQAIEGLYWGRLREYADRERAVQMALVGPHRDDIVFEIGGYPARMYGSQGQWRTAAVSLKLAVYHLLKQRRGMPPLLLLDEIFAELDPTRTAALVDAFEGFSQLFLTTAQEPTRQLKGLGRCYRVVNGRIEDM